MITLKQAEEEFAKLQIELQSAENGVANINTWISTTREEIRSLTQQLGEAEAKLTKPLKEYTRERGVYQNENAQRVGRLQSRLRFANLELADLIEKHQRDYYGKQVAEITPLVSNAVEHVRILQAQPAKAPRVKASLKRQAAVSRRVLTKTLKNTITNMTDVILVEDYNTGNSIYIDRKFLTALLTLLRDETLSVQVDCSVNVLTFEPGTINQPPRQVTRQIDALVITYEQGRSRLASVKPVNDCSILSIEG